MTTTVTTIADNSTINDPYPVPFEWAREFLRHTSAPKLDPSYPVLSGWYPQINGTWIACPGCGEG